MKDFFEILFDKRFSLKFRILNILSGDYLRNCLGIGVQSYINDCERILNDNNFSDDYKIKTIKRNIVKAKKGMNDIWNL